jgi:hypothetical protein
MYEMKLVGLYYWVSIYLINWDGWMNLKEFLWCVLIWDLRVKKHVHYFRIIEVKRKWRKTIHTYRHTLEFVMQCKAA